MGAPYVSHRKLVENSLSAMLAAIEIYNKPLVGYREEIVVVMVVNAWELALKAVLRKAHQPIFYHKHRNSVYRSLSITDCISRVSIKNLWPESVDGRGVSANLNVLIRYRDETIHLYPAKGLDLTLYNFLQQNILNYRDLIFEIFGKDLADKIKWRLLPLGASAPTENIQFMKVDPGKETTKVVHDFVNSLYSIVKAAEDASADMERVATVYDLSLRSIRNIDSADLVVGVESSANARVIQRKIDPNETHPFFRKDLIEKINKAFTGRKINSYDLDAVIWKYNLRNESKYSWKPRKGGSYQWSGEALMFFRNLTYEQYDVARRDYGQYRKEKQARNKS